MIPKRTSRSSQISKFTLSWRKSIKIKPWKNVHFNNITNFEWTNSYSKRNKEIALWLVKKFLNAKVCETFDDSFEIRTHKKSTRNNGFLLQIHKVHLQLTKSCFHSMGVNFYNSLPIEHRQAECTGDIRGFLKSIFEL